METICFILLKWGTGKLDSLLFFVPLALLIIIWGSTHLVHIIRQKIHEYKELLQVLSEEEQADQQDAILSPV